jgi:hypothetical protein
MHSEVVVRTGSNQDLTDHDMGARGSWSGSKGCSVHIKMPSKTFLDLWRWGLFVENVDQGGKSWLIYPSPESSRSRFPACDTNVKHLGKKRRARSHVAHHAHILHSFGLRSSQIAWLLMSISPTGFWKGGNSDQRTPSRADLSICFRAESSTRHSIIVKIAHVLGKTSKVVMYRMLGGFWVTYVGRK